MIFTANHITTPAWLTLASGTMNAVQHRRAPRYDAHKIEDDPVDALLGAPDPLPPMVNLAEDWAAMNGTGDRAFCVKRPDQLGTTLQLLAALRLCATFKDFQTNYALCDPAAITLLHVGHSDWILPISRAMQDLLPDHALFYDPDERRSGDLMVLSPQTGDNPANAKDAARFAKTIGEALEREAPILLITAGHRALPSSIANILPAPIRLAPIDADIILALLHLRFLDGDARRHSDLRRALPAPDMLARLGLDALHAAFREADGPAIVASLARQAAALIPTDGPTLEDMSDANGAVIAARQLMADLKLWSEGRLAWRDCLHSMLLYGQPGTGKTFLARAMGRSGGIPLICASFARWQACGHLGEMLRAMTDTFAEAIAAAPCVLFIDEIDAAGSRDSSERQNGSYRRQVVNAFLEQIDIAMRAEGVLIVGACNNVSALDPAILRPGRFDSLIEVPLPGRDELTTMLTHQLGADLRPNDLPDLVDAAIGATPAMVDAAIRSARSHARTQGKPMQIATVIQNLNDGESIDRALMWRIAVHECGHAILAISQDLGALHHVRLGQKDGNTKLIPNLGAGLKRDHQNMLAYTLAGRAAELLIFGSTGGGSGGSEPNCDLAFATHIALAMETSYGFGEDGLLWSPPESGNRITDPVLRAALRQRLDAAENEAKQELERHRVLLVEMAKDLLLHRILEGKTLNLWIDRINGAAPRALNDPTGERQEAEGSAIYGKRKDNIDLASQRLGPT